MQCLFASQVMDSTSAETHLAMQDKLGVVVGLQRQLAHSEQALSEARRLSAAVQLPHCNAVLQNRWI